MKTRYILTPMVMLAMLIALSMPASALEGPIPIDALNRFEVAVPNGNFAMNWTPYPPTPFNFFVPDEELYWVGIYDSVWMPEDPYATYNGHYLSVTDENSIGSGLGACAFWFDNETGNTTQGAENTYQSWNVGSGHGTGVPIVYKEPGNPNTLYYWFYQGYDDADGYSGCDGYSHCMEYTFQNVTASDAAQWTLMVAVTCADDGNIVFNGNALPNGYDASTKYYHVATNDVTGMVQNGDNVVKLRTDDEYFHPYWMWLVGYTPVEPKPDLTVTVIDHDTIYNGTFNIINATVKNVGMGDASEFNVTLSVDSSVVDTVTVSGLNASANTTVLLAWTPDSTSSYTLNVTADADNTVVESNEENNWMETIVTPVEIPPTDLVVADVSNGNVFVDEENVILAVIENNGEDASGFNVSLEVDGVLVNKTFVPMLYFRSQQLVWVEWTPTSTGVVQMNITVDCDGDITEQDENNNTRSQVVNLVKPTIIKVPDKYSTIQSAIDNAPNDTMILVDPGVYNETITIPADKSSIRLIANGSGVVIQPPEGGGRPPPYLPFLITIGANDVWIEGFVLIDGNPPICSGIEILLGVRRTVILDNYIGNMDCGIYLRGSWSFIKGNRIGDSGAGRPCRDLMFITGTVNLIYGNTFDGDTGGGWWMTRGPEIPMWNVVYCNDFTVTGVGGGPGPTVFGGVNNLIFTNKINDAGGPIVTRMTNWYNIPVPIPVNWYNIRWMPGGNIVHGPFLGGNYWTGNTGFVDVNRDLIDDVPYRVDRLPLIQARCGDVNCNGQVNRADASLVRNHWSNPLLYPLCNPWAADANCNGAINRADASLIRNNWAFGYPLNCGNYKCWCI